MRTRVSVPILSPTRLMLVALTATIALSAATPLYAQPIVPGTGELVPHVGDDFEDENWSYVFNNPKSSSNLDNQPRWPAGQSTNQKWEESHYRGQPDIIRRIPTPEGGLPGSRWSLLMRSVHTGIPGTLTNQMQQDDFLMRIGSLMGGYIPISWTPNVVVRVFLPPFEYWEKRTGTSFGFRADVQTTKTEQVGRFLSRRTVQKRDSYWPGMFIQFNSKTDPLYNKDSAVFLLRADENGKDVMGPKITKTGWWTLGMSFTPDGQVHYYASPGVDDLTPDDHIGSYHPYGFRCETFNTVFFNIVNQDDGRSWSTEWVIDDPSFYFIRR